MKETRWPASLSCLRRASSVVTVSVRNEVAVGTWRDSSMYLASIALAPLISVASLLVGAEAPLVSAARTSALEIRPAGPEPWTLARSTPWAAATRAATGVTLMASGIGGGGALPCGRGAAVGSGALAAGRAPLPVVIRAMTWPTCTVSPAWARISAIVPAAGAGISASTLSVDTSTTVSSSATSSPGCLAHSRIVPSVTDSPIAGITISTVAPGASSDASAGGASAAGPEPFGAISASTAPTLMVSPSATWIFTTVPAAGEGTSASTLSVDISTRTSSSETWSPSCLCHSSTVPSETESPICGMVTWTVVLTAISGFRPYRVPADPPPVQRVSHTR